MLPRWTFTGNVADSLRKLANLLGRTPVYGAYRVTTTDTTFVDSDDVIGANTTGGDVTLTMPPAADNLGRRFTGKKKAAGNNLVFDGNGGELLDGAATVTVTADNASRTWQSDGVGWQLVASG